MISKMMYNDKFSIQTNTKAHKLQRVKKSCNFVTEI